MAFSSDDLPTPLWPATTLSRPEQQLREPLDAEAGLRAEQQHLVAHLAVDAHQRLQRGRIDQIDLVDADHGPDAPLSAVTSNRSIRFGFSRGSAALVTITA